MPPVDSSTKREYAAIDIAKLICALLVVAIHTEPFAGNFWLDKGLGLFTRIPVPFIFTASGYFLFLTDKRATSGRKLLKYMGRITLMYGIWSLIYMPFLVKSCMPAETSGTFATARFIKSLIWTGVSSHLWYLIATIVAAGMTWLMYRRFTEKTTLIVATILLIFGTLFSTYAVLIHKLIQGEGIRQVFKILSIIDTRNGIFYGFFYLALGGFIACHHVKRSQLFNAIAACLSIVLLAAESLVAVRYLKCTSTIMWFATPFLVYFIFMFVLDCPLAIKREYAVTIRNMSTIIYTSQFLFIYLLIAIGLSMHGIPIFLGTVILGLIFSAILLGFKYKCKWLGYLY